MTATDNIDSQVPSLLRFYYLATLQLDNKFDNIRNVGLNAYQVIMVFSFVTSYVFLTKVEKLSLSVI